ncbi:hypothetical protein DL765_009399 [Monosporascus sp. GIB2]|nr:hypothetical protein DL765_009399 [Monosporascus sp. GIB2]
MGDARPPSMYIVDVGLATKNFMNAANAGRILSGTPDGKPIQTLIADQYLPDGIDVSPTMGRIFWTSMGMPQLNDGAVFSCGLDGKNIREILPRGAVHTPKQLVIDEKTSKIYVADREGLRVLRCNLDGSGLEVVIKTGNLNKKEEKEDATKWCVGVALSHMTGKIYWTQKGPSKGGKGCICRANINFLPGEDAENRSDIERVLQNLPEPINLAVDEAENKLYWTDRGELPIGNTINRVSLVKLTAVQGDTNVVSWPGKDYEMLVRNLHEGIGIKLDLRERHIYATDLGGLVYRFDMDGGNKETFYENEGTYAGITLCTT